MRITEKQMFDYMFCPAKYEMKYIKKIDLKEHKNLPKLLNTVARYFYLNLLNNKVCSMNELKNKWDSICNNNQDLIDAKKNLAGIGMIMNLVKWASEERIDVRDIDTQFSVVHKNVEVVGCLSGPILKTSNNKLEMLVTNFSERVPDVIDVDMKLKYSLDAYGFKSVHNKELDGIRIHSVKSFKDIRTRRGEIEERRLLTTIENVAKGIEQEIFYPRENVLCSSCTARSYCKYWFK